MKKIIRHILLVLITLLGITACSRDYPEAMYGCPYPDEFNDTLSQE